MPSRLFKNVKFILKKPKATVFIGFVIISFLLWFMITLSDQYTSKITLKIDYTNVPDSKLMLGDPPRTLQANVGASGFRLLGYRLFRQSLSVNVAGFKEKGSEFFLTGEDLEDDLRSQFKSLDVRRVLQDTLKVELGVNKIKRVKVVPDLDLTFQSDHQLGDTVVVIPDSVNIRGPEDQVDQLTYIKTKKLVLTDLNSDFSKEIALVAPDSLKSIMLSLNKVAVSGVVTQYSEKIIDVPVTIINVPDRVSVKTFPSEARILCKAGINDLKRLEASGFKVICDYKEISNNSSYLLLKIEEKPSFVNSATLMVSKVEYLIKRS
ncbi:CdaR family protein [Robertkochia solimangrovi]|uniref:CdaR family protein n=1 Tax=Robertkochia solimangrovi TaxID=2213046 RepID=UPI001181270B|nr:YbbR-like domain-containing protein [Robertkochia solimangrovi]TRZ41080.1 YbbR-like domain-containing protein [Robertkochia solimangrovi]